MRTSCPNAKVFEPIMRFTEAVAPTLAARRERRKIPSAKAIAAQRPKSDRPLLIETFGGPLSPLNEHELQIELIRELRLPCVLVTRSTIGAITRALTTLRLLRSESVEVFAVVLMGEADEYAAEQIERFGGTRSLLGEPDGTASRRVERDCSAIRRREVETPPPAPSRTRRGGAASQIAMPLSFGIPTLRFAEPMSRCRLSAQRRVP